MNGRNNGLSGPARQIRQSGLVSLMPQGYFSSCFANFSMEHIENREKQTGIRTSWPTNGFDQWIQAMGSPRDGAVVSST